MTPGGAASGKRGSAYERETVRRFREAGWGALRLPSSGSATDRDLPDVLAADKQDWRDYLDIIATAFDVNRSHADVVEAAHHIGRKADLYVIEQKSGKADIFYFDAEEIGAITSFANVWGGTAKLAVRSTQQATPTETFLVRPDDARRTDSGRYAVDVRDVGERAGVVVGRAGEVRVGDGP